MSAWQSNRFEDRANALLRMVILREYTPPDPLAHLGEEAIAAEWVWSYLRAIGVDGEPREYLIRYMRDIQKLRDLLAEQGSLSGGEDK